MPAPAESNSSRVIVIVLAVAAVAAVVAFALLQQPPPAPAPLPAAAWTPAPTQAPVAFSSSAHSEAVVATTTPAAPAPGARQVVSAEPAWESTIDQILRSNVSETQMAQMLITLLPTLPEEGQVEAANHIANLLPDSSYASVKPLLLNTNLPESVVSVLFTDLMNRDDPTKLNAFLEVAQISNHPFHDEALSDLQIYLGEDYGTDWSKWKNAVDQYLKTASEQ
jgi:hypothetical protein